MDVKENIGSGHRAVGDEGQSSYQVARGADNQQMTILPPVSAPTSSGMGGSMEKKKRGRPRKYALDGSTTGTLSPTPISSLGSPSAGTYSSGKRGKGQSSNSGTKHDHKSEKKGKGGASCDGVHFTPHVITVNAGEDVTSRIISFCQQGPRAICILSANGTVSNATLRQSESSGGTLTYEGRFEILNLCGSFTPTEREGTRYRAGGLSVSLSSPNGQVVGGCVAGLLVAAAPVQIIVGSFLPSIQPEHKPKKHKNHPPSASYPSAPALPPPADKDENVSNSHGRPIPEPSIQTPTPFPFGRDASWQTQAHHSMEGSRKSTDINISVSLPGGGGMQ